jgi:hypothetical protein
MQRTFFPEFRHFFSAYQIHAKSAPAKFMQQERFVRGICLFFIQKNRKNFHTIDSSQSADKHRPASSLNRRVYR